MTAELHNIEHDSGRISLLDATTARLIRCYYVKRSSTIVIQEILSLGANGTLERINGFGSKLKSTLTLYLEYSLGRLQTLKFTSCFLSSMFGIEFGQTYQSL